MSRRRRDVLARMVATIGAVLGGFALLQQPTRELETRLAVELVRLIVGAHVTPVANTSVVVVPAHGSPFLAVVTPSCSALAPVLVLACLAMLAPHTSTARRLTVLVSATSTVLAGNVVRIAASLGFGVLESRATLVLFHDAVGSMFAFGYVMGGYVLMLYLLLPAQRRHRRVLAGV